MFDNVWNDQIKFKNRVPSRYCAILYLQVTEGRNDCRVVKFQNWSGETNASEASEVDCDKTLFCFSTCKLKEKRRKMKIMTWTSKLTLKVILPFLAFHSSDKSVIAVQCILNRLGQLQVSSLLFPLWLMTQLSVWYKIAKIYPVLLAKIFPAVFEWHLSKLDSLCRKARDSRIRPIPLSNHTQ
jgi:hypothetical protein